MQKEKVLSYTSQQLKMHEISYMTHHLELRAIVLALTTWRRYLCGTKCAIFYEAEVSKTHLRLKEVEHETN